MLFEKDWHLIWHSNECEILYLIEKIKAPYSRIKIDGREEDSLPLFFIKKMHFFTIYLAVQSGIFDNVDDKKEEHLFGISLFMRHFIAPLKYIIVWIMCHNIFYIAIQYVA